MTEKKYCDKCGENASNDKHTCPYKEDVFRNDESLCNCCDECTYECFEET